MKASNMSGPENRFQGYLYTAAKIFTVLAAALVLALILNFAFMAVIWAYFAATTGSAAQATSLLADSVSNMWFVLGVIATQELAWVLVPVGFIAFVDRKKFSWSDLGLSFGPRALKMLAAGVLLNALTALVVFATVLLTGWQQVEVNGLAEYGPAAVAIYLAMTVLLMLMVAIGEETLFRGYIQTDLMRKYGNVTALVVSSLVFAGIHIFFLISGQEISPLSIAGIFFASLVMGYLYILTGTIWASIGFHFFQDVLAAGVFLTGELPYASYPVFAFSKAGELTLSGISLGSKDNLINIVWLILLLAALYIYDKKNSRRAQGAQRLLLILCL